MHIKNVRRLLYLSPTFKLRDLLLFCAYYYTIWAAPVRLIDIMYNYNKYKEI